MLKNKIKTKNQPKNTKPAAHIHYPIRVYMYINWIVWPRRTTKNEQNNEPKKKNKKNSIMKPASEFNVMWIFISDRQAQN